MSFPRIRVLECDVFREYVGYHFRHFFKNRLFFTDNKMRCVNKMNCGLCGKGLTPSDWTRSFVIYRENCSRIYVGDNLLEAADSLNLDYEKLIDHVAKGFNPKSTGLFPPGAALGGVFSTPHVRLDPDILES